MEYIVPVLALSDSAMALLVSVIRSERRAIEKFSRKCYDECSCSVRVLQSQGDTVIELDDLKRNVHCTAVYICYFEGGVLN